MEQMQLSLNVSSESLEQAVARYWSNRPFQIQQYVDRGESNE